MLPPRGFDIILIKVRVAIPSSMDVESRRAIFILLLFLDIQSIAHIDVILNLKVPTLYMT